MSEIIKLADCPICPGTEGRHVEGCPYADAIEAGKRAYHEACGLSPAETE